MIAVLMFVVAVALVSGAPAEKDCRKELEKANGAGLLGAFKPNCNNDGTYQSVQCHESYCYCVFPRNGEEVLETRVRFTRPKSCDLTECFLKRHAGWKLLNMGLLGVYSPRCDENGDFQSVQCRKGMCWCSDPKTGKALGKASNSMPDC